MISIALSLRGIDLEIKNNMPYDIYYDCIINRTNQIENLLAELNQNANNWKHCSEFNILYKNSIPVVDYTIKGHYIKMNLYDFLSAFKANVLKYLGSHRLWKIKEWK